MSDDDAISHDLINGDEEREGGWSRKLELTTAQYQVVLEEHGVIPHEADDT